MRRAAAAVAVHGGDQGLDRGELQLRPDPAEEGDRDLLAVEVAGKIEEEDFEERRAVVEGRPPAVARDAVEDRAVGALQADRVDAVAEAAIGAEPDVGGREAEFAAAAVAGDDLADRRTSGSRDARLAAAMSPAARCLADARSTRTARRSRRETGPNDDDGEAEPLAGFGEERRRARPALAEMEIVADDGRLQPQPADENLLDEGFGRIGGERPVEVRDDEAVDAERVRRRAFAGERRQAEDRRLGAEDACADAARR